MKEGSQTVQCLCVVCDLLESLFCVQPRNERPLQRIVGGRTEYLGSYSAQHVGLAANASADHQSIAGQIRSAKTRELSPKAEKCAQLLQLCLALAPKSTLGVSGNITWLLGGGCAGSLRLQDKLNTNNNRKYTHRLSLSSVA
jgi:hypothetical protein